MESLAYGRPDDAYAADALASVDILAADGQSNALRLKPCVGVPIVSARHVTSITAKPSGPESDESRRLCRSTRSAVS
jgi:hypothetical protein